MTKRSNIAASVHQRLLNRARKESRPFNELLQRFVNERFLHRLSKSPNEETFVLKGALMFGIWGGPGSRPTMDIDLLGSGVVNSRDRIVSALKAICEVEVEPDGVLFDPTSVTATRITEGAEHEGVRGRLRGKLGNTRMTLQIDIAFGDIVTPGPVRIVYPALLEFPVSELNGYTRESTIAEKLQAMVKLGELNSRMKDFYDLVALSRACDFRGSVLAEAIRKTFTARKTSIPPNFDALIHALASDPNKQRQWEAFLTKSQLVDSPRDFVDAVSEIRDFLEPVIRNLCEGRKFRGTWEAPGPWKA